MIEIDDGEEYYKITGKNARFHQSIPPFCAMKVKVPEGIYVVFAEDRIKIQEKRL